MQISDLDYELPNELIAQQPLERREGSRMMVVDRARSSFEDRMFSQLPDIIREGDLLVLNNTRVFPARLIGTLGSGARIEIFLVREIEADIWECLARPGRRLRKGKEIIIADDLSADVLEKTEDGRVIVRLRGDSLVDDLVDRYGKTPLPPYIKRDEAASDPDRERYQTVFAAKRGAIAAPTAGLHFTPEVLDEIRARGADIAEITLHVGYGTFEPVRAENLSEHTVLPEQSEISEQAAAAITNALDDGRRIIAVGTTTTRTLESCFFKNGAVVAGRHTADITITPGFKFEVVGALLTNFHLPKSSLLLLTSTFGGHELIMRAYRHAVSEKYRFYSYGDCMLIL